MDTQNENLETVVENEMETPVAATEEFVTETPAEEAYAEETCADEVPADEFPAEETADEAPAAGEAPAEPARKARKFPKLPKIRITKKGAIIGGIAAAVVIIAVVLIVLLTGNGKVYEYTKDGTTMTVTVLEDGFKVEGLSEEFLFSTWRTEDDGTYQKNSDGTYTLIGYWADEDIRLVHFTGDYYLIKRDNGKGATDVVYELGKDNKYKMYAFYADITYSKNDDGTYRLGETDNVKLKDAGDGMYSVVSVNGEKDHDFGSTLVKLDPKLGVYRQFYRSSKTYKVIEGEEKTIVRETEEGSKYSAEYWIEGEFLTKFGVSEACNYIQKQRGDDRIVYLMDESGDVKVITITNGKTYLDGVNYKELGNGKYYAIEGGREYRLHLYSNGTYKLYEEITDDDQRGRAELIWEPEEKLEVKVDGETLFSIIVDGKTMTVGGEEAAYELKKVK